MKLIELAWAAGFWDGEGCCFTGVRKKGYRYIAASVSQSLNTICLERFLAAIEGIGKIYGPYEDHRNGRSARYEWRVSRLDDVLAVKDLLWPYLSDPKRQQFDTKLWEYDE